MKRKVFGIIGAAAVSAAVAFSGSIKSEGSCLSDIALANVEALAKNEGFGDIWIVTYYSQDHWQCDPGSKWCCPHPSGGCL